LGFWTENLNLTQKGEEVSTFDLAILPFIMQFAPFLLAWLKMEVRERKKNKNNTFNYLHQPGYGFVSAFSKKSLLGFASSNRSIMCTGSVYSWNLEHMRFGCFIII
jgi:hypothetical protein